MSSDDAAQVKQLDGILVPGGFGDRGNEGKIDTIKHARTQGVPFLGICMGMQCAVIEYARNVLNMNEAHSTEHVPDSPHPVVTHMPETSLDVKGGTMRLGKSQFDVATGTLASKIYGADIVTIRHRHRYEVNPAYVDRLEAAGLRFSGRAGARMEAAEIADHPCFFALQGHPEFSSRPLRPCPAFIHFLQASVKGR